MPQPGAQASLEALRESIRNNPANVARYRAALACACERIPFDEAAQVVAAASAPATCTVYPRNALTNLVRKGALEQSATVDGELYAGSPEDLARDESVSAEAEVVYYLRTTEAGRALLAELEPGSRIEALLEDKPSFLQGFLLVLDLCASQVDGAAKAQIEGGLRAHPETLAIDEQTGLEGVAPSFYTTNLEDAGALTWADGRWRITDAGACALAEWMAGDCDEERTVP